MARTTIAVLVWLRFGHPVATRGRVSKVTEFVQGGSLSRVKVFFTVDVEVWPGGWSNIDARFPEAFRHYIYGDTAYGQYGLPLKLRVLRDNGLKGVFFVEPLFSFRFGLQPLQEIVGLITEGGQEVQLHLHAEWVNESRTPLLSWVPDRKIQHISHFALKDQTVLVERAKQRLAEAGAAPATVFRAGSFAFNADTLRALEANGVLVDSSYNHYFGGPTSGIWHSPDRVPVAPFEFGRVLEVPVTVYRDFPFHVRPLQLKGCSLSELTTVMQRAADDGHGSIVIVSHSFELLDRRDFSRDEIVAQRFFGLCEFLARNSDTFETCFLGDDPPASVSVQPSAVAGSATGLAVRYIEQFRRRL
jgi:hypothetical protein